MTTATTNEPKPGETPPPAPDAKPGTPPAAGDQQPKPGEAGTAGTPTPGDQKTPDGQKPGEQPPPGAPDKYTLVPPKDGLIDAEDLSEVEALAREYNLPNDVAQSMLETTHAHMVKKSETWAAQLTADKVYGGDKLPETQQLANAGLDKIAPKGTVYGDGLRRLLTQGIGNNLYVMAALATVGRMTKEDTPIEGSAGGGTTSPKSAAEILYPDSPEFKKKG